MGVFALVTTSPNESFATELDKHVHAAGHHFLIYEKPEHVPPEVDGAFVDRRGIAGAFGRLPASVPAVAAEPNNIALNRVTSAVNCKCVISRQTGSLRESVRNAITVLLASEGRLRATFIDDNGQREEQTKRGRIAVGSHGTRMWVDDHPVPDWISGGDHVVIAGEAGHVVAAYEIRWLASVRGVAAIHDDGIKRADGIRFDVDEYCN